eukprot:scaffold5037_cov180-Skeletonema_marinoi.AAC.3
MCHLSFASVDVCYPSTPRLQGKRHTQRSTLHPKPNYVFVIRPVGIGLSQEIEREDGRAHTFIPANKMDYYLRICVNRRILFCACWLGSVFYFVSFSHQKFENIMLQNTSHASQQWWLNQTIDPNCSCETPWDSSVAPTDRMECCHRSV